MRNTYREHGLAVVGPELIRVDLLEVGHVTRSRRNFVGRTAQRFLQHLLRLADEFSQALTDVFVL